MSISKQTEQAVLLAENSVQPVEPLERWKVGVIEQVLTEYTVYAHDPNEAIDNIRKGFGRHAGMHGPEIVEILCKPMGGFNTPEEEDEKTTRVNPNESLIFVPGGIS